MDKQQQTSAAQSWGDAIKGLITGNNTPTVTTSVEISSKSIQNIAVGLAIAGIVIVAFWVVGKVIVKHAA